MVYDPFDPYLYGGASENCGGTPRGGGTENERFRRRETAGKLKNKKIISQRAEKTRCKDGEAT